MDGLLLLSLIEQMIERMPRCGPDCKGWRHDMTTPISRVALVHVCAETHASRQRQTMASITAAHLLKGPVVHAYTLGDVFACGESAVNGTQTRVRGLITCTGGC